MLLLLSLSLTFVSHISSLTPHLLCSFFFIFSNLFFFLFNYNVFDIVLCYNFIVFIPLLSNLIFFEQNISQLLCPFVIFLNNNLFSFHTSLPSLLLNSHLAAESSSLHRRSILSSIQPLSTTAEISDNTQTCIFEPYLQISVSLQFPTSLHILLLLSGSILSNPLVFFIAFFT